MSLVRRGRGMVAKIAASLERRSRERVGGYPAGDKTPDQIAPPRPPLVNHRRDPQAGFGKPGRWEL